MTGFYHLARRKSHQLVIVRVASEDGRWGPQDSLKFKDRSHSASCQGLAVKVTKTTQAKINAGGLPPLNLPHSQR
jgi:hypothetical protein